MDARHPVTATLEAPRRGPWQERDRLIGWPPNSATRWAGDSIPQLFGWMIHVNPYETDPKLVWGTHEQKSGERDNE